MALKAVALNCTLKSSSAKDVSSTEKLLGQILTAFAKQNVTGEIIRIADQDAKPGVASDEGSGGHPFVEQANRRTGVSPSCPAG